MIIVEEPREPTWRDRIAEALIDTINTIFRRDRPRTTIDDMQDQSSGPGYSDVAKTFQVQKNRKDRVETCREMYDEDTRGKQIVQTLARDVVKGGFQLEIDDDRAAEVADELRQRIGLDDRLDDWVRLTLRDGDSFLELGVTQQREIAKTTRKPTLHMFRNTNRADEFEDPTKAFWYSDKPWAAKPTDDAIWFAQWQIIHSRWDHDEGNKYGRPLMSASRGPWKRVKEGELDIAVRRKTRAGMKFVHSIEGDEADVARYKEQNKAAINNPLAAVVDFFFNQKVTLSAVQGDANLDEIRDVMHHIDTFFLGSPIAKSLLGYGQDIDFSVIGHQKEQYDETLEAVQGWVAAQLIKPLLERQWLLAGIFPDNLTYEVKWAPKQRVTAADIEKIVKAMAMLRAMNIPDEVIAMLLARWLPGIEPEMLMPDSGANGNTERLAQISQRLMNAFNA